MANPYQNPSAHAPWAHFSPMYTAGVPDWGSPQNSPDHMNLDRRMSLSQSHSSTPSLSFASSDSGPTTPADIVSPSSMNFPRGAARSFDFQPQQMFGNPFLSPVGTKPQQYSNPQLMFQYDQLRAPQTQNFNAAPIYGHEQAFRDQVLMPNAEANMLFHPSAMHKTIPSNEHHHAEPHTPHDPASSFSSASAAPHLFVTPVSHRDDVMYNPPVLGSPFGGVPSDELADDGYNMTSDDDEYIDKKRPSKSSSKRTSFKEDQYKRGGGKRRKAAVMVTDGGFEMQYCGGTRAYTCKRCNKKFHRKEHLNRHVKASDNRTMFHCAIGMMLGKNVCDKSLNRNDNLVQHHATHVAGLGQGQSRNTRFDIRVVEACIRSTPYIEEGKPLTDEDRQSAWESVKKKVEGEASEPKKWQPERFKANQHLDHALLRNMGLDCDDDCHFSARTGKFAHSDTPISLCAAHFNEPKDLKGGKGMRGKRRSDASAGNHCHGATNDAGMTDEVDTQGFTADSSCHGPRS